ncbi:uncharacterized protein LOC127255203 isoform X2 [Andrographis paniculata]|uniref:uncharacterized protein LOC127255203 isoform X2 n=1 Tax=Andrographis paniculata TaxID=175694 RepID=UPI0021E97974|nr:uncharacterized protein LOC127255203 isoform X2 [Andrographis paniculata]
MLSPSIHPSIDVVGKQMEMEMEEKKSADAAVEDAKRRCVALRDSLHRMSATKLSVPVPTLLRLINSELAFLHRLSSASSPSPSPLSLNIGHLEAVAHVLLQPFVTGVSRVCKPINLSAAYDIYVDIVCSVKGNPAWVIVSDRNPRFITWEGGSLADKNKGLQEKIRKVVDAACLSPPALRPSSVLLFFSHGLVDEVYQKLEREFGSVKLGIEPFFYEEFDLEDKWTNLVLGRSFLDACVVEIEVNKENPEMEKNYLDPVRADGTVSCSKCDAFCDLNVGASLRTLVYGMKCWCCHSNDNLELESGPWKNTLTGHGAELVNFDTTAMVAIVSGISNGKTDKLLNTPESELRGRFKGNYDFMISQVQSEKQNPIHKEMIGIMLGKRGIVCESVCSEFQELVLMCGGPNEKLRAEYFKKFLRVVPDCPSTRLMSLPTTRKLALKNKVVFGTGDYWGAPTVTANMAFVRAVTQTGMSLCVAEHKPRALIGE